jgi:hypothetical protein
MSTSSPESIKEQISASLENQSHQIITQNNFVKVSPSMCIISSIKTVFLFVKYENFTVTTIYSSRVVLNLLIYSFFAILRMCNESSQEFREPHFRK